MEMMSNTSSTASVKIQRRRKRKNSDTSEYLKIALLNCRKLRLEQQLEVMAPKIKATCDSGFTFYYSVKNSTTTAAKSEEEFFDADKFDDLMTTNSDKNENKNNIEVSETNQQQQDNHWDPLEPFKALDSFTESAKNISNESDDSEVVQAYQLLQELMVSANNAESILSKNNSSNDTSTICTDTLLMLKLASASLHPKQMFEERYVF